MPLARLRLQGELLELRADDLCFTPTELSEFLRLHELCVDHDELRDLHTRTDGWPAGVQFATTAMPRGIADVDDPASVVRSVERAVSDFMVSEILIGLRPELVEFLVETSVLDVFDADLCAAVTRVDASDTMLGHLAATGLFVVPLDAERRWFRFQPQFGAFLRARLAASGTGKLRAMQERAGQALEDRGDDIGALRTAMATPECDRPCRLVRAAFGRASTQSDAVLPPAGTNVVLALVEPLSPREVAVLRYMRSRLTYREIASMLYVSVNTLKSHVRSIFRKLAVASREDAIAAGRSHGLL